MAYNNFIFLQGHVGRDAETRFSASGVQVATFSLAVNRGKDKPVDWFKVVSFGWKAEQAEAMAKKGAKVQVTGQAQVEQWENRDGSKRSAPVIVAENLAIIPSKQDEAHTNAPEPKVQDSYDYSYPSPEQDEIPF